MARVCLKQGHSAFVVRVPRPHTAARHDAHYLPYFFKSEVTMTSKVEQPPAETAPAQWTTNMTASTLTSATGNSCLDEQIERLKRCEYLREGEVKALCLRAREILVDESNVQRVDAPVTVSKL